MVRVGGNKNVGGAEKGRQKHRSPNYPLFDLGKAVEYAKKLYDKDKTHKVPVGLVHERWGYKPHSGLGNQAVGALSSYGLIAVEGSGEARQIAVSDEARRIILNASNRKSLLKQAAVSPALFGSLWNQYRDDGLPSDEVLKHSLLFDRNFNEDVVDRVISRFKATVAYAGLIAGDKIEGANRELADDEDDENESIEADPPRNEGRDVTAVAPQDAAPTVVRDFSIPLLNGGIAVIEIPFPMSKPDFDQLSGTLAAWEGVLVRADLPKLDRVSGRTKAEATHDDGGGDDDDRMDPDSLL